MAVRMNTFNFSILFILVLLVVINPITSNLVKCQRGMLNNYGLVGKTYSSTAPMKICGHIIDNCCALVDEVKIVTLWNYHTKPILERHTTYCIDTLLSIVSYFAPLSALNPELIIVKQITTRQTVFKEEKCIKVTSQMSQTQNRNFERFVDGEKHVKRKTSALFEKGKRTWGISSESMNQKTLRALNKMKSGRMRSYYETVGRVRNENVIDRNEKIRKERQEGRKLKGSERKLSEVFVDSNSGVNQKTKESDSFLKNTQEKLNNRNYKPTQKSLNVKKTDSGMDSSEMFKQKGRVLAESRNLKKHSKKSSRSQPKKKEDSFLSIPKPNLTTLRCEKNNSKYTRDYVIINPRKVRFCYRIYSDFLHYNIQFFNETIADVRKSMLAIGYLRKQFFCSLCDGHGQNYFEHKKMVVIYDQEFCSDVIKTHLDYFQFMNILFVEFADSLLQYVQCFETDAQIYNFPFQNFLVKYKRRIHFYRKCFMSVMGGDPSYIKKCWFICNKFSLLRMNQIFDGDLPMLTRVKIALFSFLRKFTQQKEVDESLQEKNFVARNVSKIDLGIVENVDGILIEPVSPGLLISNKRFVLHESFRPNYLGDTSISGIPQIQPKQWTQVNEFLTSLGLSSIDQLIDIHKSNAAERANFTLTSQLKARPHDQTIRNPSEINGMVNQLYELLNSKPVGDHMVPRKMKQEVITIIKKSGFTPTPFNRRLQDMDLFPNFKKTPTNDSPKKWALEHPDIESLNGKKIKVKKKEPDVSENNVRFNVEARNEIFEKIEETIDMYNYGVTFESTGLNPVAVFYYADFEKNVTTVIGENFPKSEKIDGDVLRDYILYNKTKINEFNELFDYEIVSFVDISARDKLLNRYKTIENYSVVNDRLRLKKVAQQHQVDIFMVTKEKESKRRRDIERMKLIKKYEKAKAFDKLSSNDFSHQLTSNLPGFNDTFSGISSFFLNMFGN